MGTESSPGKVDDVAEIDRLAQMAQRLFKLGKPVLKESLRQTQEALTTGGVEARIPIIQRAVEASKLASANALRSTEESLASTPGLAGTPFASRTLADARMAAEQRTSQIPTTYAQNIIDAGQPLAFGAVQAGLGGTGQAAGLELGRKEFNVQAFASFMKDLKDSVEKLAYSGQ